MPIDPSFLPPAASPDDFAVPGDRVPVAPLGGTPLPPATPNLGHTLVFGILVALAGFFIGLLFQLALMHLAPHMRESAEQMQTDPLLVIPVEALIYAIAGAASFLLFPFLWRRPFGHGIHWRAFIVRRHTWLLVGIGVATSVVVQLLSNFLPIPKELPIDKFFTHPLGVWLIAIFGVTVAPAFEELAFRGFLLPSLASAWDWVIQRARTPRDLLGGPKAQQLPEGEWQQQTAVYPSVSSDAVNVFDRAADFGDAQRDSSNAQHGWGNAELGSSNAERGSGDAERGAPNPDPHWSIPALIFSTIITSIGFAMLHGAQLAHSFAPLAVLFAVSVVLCITRLRFHSLAASTLVHSLYNATIFVMLFIGTDGFRHLDKLGK
ncbi:MAG TPA: type II CAAX endopeptidase family protein [Acidobacteriaceae bacterium]|jgi:membrane protease YdiL (CAAX protease family)|nr:type II CAAX endopeptidase family protein [Acidobacteriaceae bacterium]